ncbi:1-acyl-sn-glycerol-3-phosphate acyltransferase [Pseudoalteromonas sp. 13-15]|uniref:1-acyl-sn-glycerol-3-phosphate acyltransferase n=1 Tax=Pseudoalteromonas marina TaxID=267375 RepID=A0ABT9FEI8_9GAMM|nr:MULTISPECIES: 1-acylglycerol-3-phosphate O-acyltransferase [Pseudoalteromonas]EAW27504.1 1-acyl-sn-glycerol-3-phosphate acyltransferase [Alteromonadales bacterium TW-7]ATG57195.1 1-acyl-sn-glycerol-3-phosphate acyltransferase [Pseudoalteromonas marina]AUL73720.1 1-acyl-sn-glycerol-3-phosphate acyltransferase [Pseudoalteromonas sp. 13-15]KAF7777066.1 1-acyl-sn-glycerol-3-phosphate acyltransferase [Pseudoalteromonas marina]MDP2486223.1 1-acylglycerol-3-phosphate O-acyltransferase [Pseudoalter
MLAVIRVFIMFMFILLSCIFGLLLSLVRPFHPNNVHIIAGWFGSMAKMIGVKLVLTRHQDAENIGPAVYVANHQNSYDLFTVPAMVPKNCVSLGKKSLKWIPFFGQLYWLSGNILIDRANRSKAAGTISKAAEKIKKNGLSIWVFAEGTRSYGRGLLPFKTGAFHTAMSADVPVVPVCMNTTHKTIKLNRWDNGTIYIEMLAPISLDKSISAREHAQNVHTVMAAKINELDAQVREK